MFETKDIIAIIAFLLSLFLAIREWWKTQPSFEVAPFFTGQIDVDDEIVIYNKSNRNVIITDIGLYSVKGSRHKEIYLGNEGDQVLITILPHNVFRLCIPDHFKFIIEDELYIMAKIMGKDYPMKISVIDNDMD
ncbi:hypothetical protein HZQ19_01830 [Elizabethkingia anophelis]|uniref:hypothetical protein n=1 Tax=Elizabethkingia anophelis TaxID=1117645 RepID=UPI000C9B4FF5|nr:hypothetical protein [Elizabethkingia anophelis]MCT3758437.1 hypothetical protein [Elizabethkingia anophelis]MCT3971915.1 hypothetical protein [Elizabethkingia anophelis]MCT4000392.1 hypothetical protein [Elizabethkingia anophelis]MCT4014627.1 hypothetical protein [Elizabethkingia anophelis]MCT4018188.1 hypothetical protein [Elizabethkingia anophelis]